jgi:type II secretory pathway pseudopilin PulG
MKIRLAIALIGLAIGFALPTFAKQKDTVNPQIEQQIRALAMKFDEAYNRNDAAASPRSTRRTGFISRRRTEHFTVGRPSKKTMQNTVSRTTFPKTCSQMSIA